MIQSDDFVVDQGFDVGLRNRALQSGFTYREFIMCIK